MNRRPLSRTPSYPIRSPRVTTAAETGAIVSVGIGCFLLWLALIAVRVVTLVIAISDLASGHPSHVVLDVLLILFAW